MDLVIVCVFGWCVSVGARQGVFSEIFRLSGVFFTTVFALHFFSICAQFLKNFIPIPPRYAEFIAYVLLWIFIVMCFKVACSSMGLFQGIHDGDEKVSSKNRIWGGTLGFFRAILVSGLIFTGVVIFDYTPVFKASQASLSGKILFHISPEIYKNVHNNGIVKLFPNERINSKLFQRFEDVKYLH